MAEVQPCRQFDGLDAAGLVEGVAVLVGYVSQDLAGAFAIDAANKGFLRENRAVRQVEDGLKGHGDRHFETDAVPATGAFDRVAHISSPTLYRGRVQDGY